MDNLFYVDDQSPNTSFVLNAAPGTAYRVQNIGHSSFTLIAATLNCGTLRPGESKLVFSNGQGNFTASQINSGEFAVGRFDRP
jgi:hypothetical protein